MGSAIELEQQALAQFDRLVEAGELLWTEVKARHAASTPFSFQFRVAASLAKKPQTATQKKVSHAFEDDNPDFSLGKIGPNHKLILNKFCVIRPQFVLHTVEFEPQQTPLSFADLDALWNVLSRLESEHIAIFNCGAEAGASMGHKHMQVLPHPGREEFELFLDVVELGSDIHVCANVPFQHAIQKLSETADTDALVKIYQTLHNHLSLGQQSPHNVILTNRWLMVVPRRRGRIGPDELLAANAAAMVGMVWVTEEREYELWTEGDPMRLLPEFGVPHGEAAT
ncbi:hypothetical protein BU23DRAFT_286166 [Bimuria novae-zelandiae CBS 107.79]|uniref:Uncharacterized protein n=1 Tax=Bimuria novae-zelandiae CBS 107.79 TaxID=1447943 RepID=A0A6A5UTL2_9PLEO|nr:hypothetical protein BU23DRAFT_286166 [Bimuria novae-zelandiae CBS 107.79]